MAVLTGFIVIAMLCQLAAEAIWCFPLKKYFSDSKKDLESPPSLIVPDDENQNDPTPHEQLRMNMYAANQPHPYKVAYGGDDAYYTSHENQIFTINDGVSGSASKQLHCYPNVVSRILALKTVESFIGTSDWRSAMNAAFRQLESENICGTTTTVVIRKLFLDNRDVVAVYNLGDCRVAHLRLTKKTNQYKLVKITDVQKHGSVNCPYQATGDKSVYQGSGVEQMQEYQFEVEKGDLIIGASDGLWDVVDETSIAGLCNGYLPNLVATRLMTWASRVRQSTFSLDDITVVVGHIVASDLNQVGSDQNNYGSIEETIERIKQEKRSNRIE